MVHLIHWIWSASEVRILRHLRSVHFIDHILVYGKDVVDVVVGDLFGSSIVASIALIIVL